MQLGRAKREREAAQACKREREREGEYRVRRMSVIRLVAKSVRFVLNKSLRVAACQTEDRERVRG